MSKQSKQPSVPPFIESEWSDHPLAEWISNNKQFILWSLAGLFAVLIIAARVLMHSNSNAESDYFKAQIDFNEFQQAAADSSNKFADSNSLKDLETILNRYPELHAKYDAAIAQTLIIENEISKAEPFAKATFQRTKDDSIKNYHEYAATSLLIGTQEYQKALTNTLQLQEVLQNEVQKGQENTLYLFNLIRLAMLHQQLDNKQEEAKIWSELQQLASQPHVINLLNLFTQGNATFNQYIQKRKIN